MKYYKVSFDIVNGDKIPLIKAIRTITNCGLKEAKDFVEEKLFINQPYFACNFLLTDTQLGRYFIYKWRNEEFAFSLNYFEEYIAPTLIDLTSVKERD